MYRGKSNLDPKYQIRSAKKSDLPGILAVKSSLSIQRSDSTREGFLLGASQKFYEEMIARGIASVIESTTTNEIKGIGFALPWELLKENDVWKKRAYVKWSKPILSELECGKPGYIEQLAVLPGQTIRFLAPGLAYSLIEKLFESKHTHILATTVLKPMRNLAALKLLDIVQAEVVGEIEEEYPEAGNILSQVHSISGANYQRIRESQAWRGRVLNYLEKTNLDRSR